MVLIFFSFVFRACAYTNLLFNIIYHEASHIADKYTVLAHTSFVQNRLRVRCTQNKYEKQMICFFFIALLSCAYNVCFKSMPILHGVQLSRYGCLNAQHTQFSQALVEVIHSLYRKNVYQCISSSDEGSSKQRRLTQNTTAVYNSTADC